LVAPGEPAKGRDAAAGFGASEAEPASRAAERAALSAGSDMESISDDVVTDTVGVRHELKKQLDSKS
jgi:hypothetical protein